MNLTELLARLVADRVLPQDNRVLEKPHRLSDEAIARIESGETSERDAVFLLKARHNENRRIAYREAQYQQR